MRSETAGTLKNSAGKSSNFLKNGARPVKPLEQGLKFFKND